MKEYFVKWGSAAFITNELNNLAKDAEIEVEGFTAIPTGGFAVLLSRRVETVK